MARGFHNIAIASLWISVFNFVVISLIGSCQYNALGERQSDLINMHRKIKARWKLETETKELMAANIEKNRQRVMEIEKLKQKHDAHVKSIHYRR